MKRRTDMRSEPTMRFFTPDLYRRYNSPDPSVAEAADAEWEKAIEHYQEYLQSIRDQLPLQVLELTNLSLHDGEILQRQVPQHPIFDRPPVGVPYVQLLCMMVVLPIRLKDEIVTLSYFLHDPIRESAADKDWPFSKDREHWLYDEIQAEPNPPGGLSHRILLSTGVTWWIPFTTVVVTRFPASLGNADGKKRSA